MQALGRLPTKTQFAEKSRQHSRGVIVSSGEGSDVMTHLLTRLFSLKLPINNIKAH